MPPLATGFYRLSSLIHGRGFGDTEHIFAWILLKPLTFVRSISLPIHVAPLIPSPGWPNVLLSALLITFHPGWVSFMNHDSVFQSNQICNLPLWTRLLVHYYD